MTIKGKSFESIQEVEAACYSVTKGTKGDFQTALGNGKRDEINAFKAGGNILRKIRDNVSFVFDFKKFKQHCILQFRFYFPCIENRYL